MTVTDVRKDPAALTMTITAEFDAPVERAWRLWADPRQLERWWGPPTHPATVVDHELVPGGTVTYFMTGPEGDRYHGWWRVVAVAEPSSLEFEDGFADDTGAPNLEMPVTATAVSLAPGAGGGTVMTLQTTFPSTEAMEQMIAMQMEEGIRQAIGQIDAILVGDPVG